MLFICTTIIITTCIICYTINRGVNVTITHVHDIRNAINEVKQDVSTETVNKDKDIPPTFDDVLKEINNFMIGDDRVGE